MALKKSDLYASLWASCDELRGGMDEIMAKRDRLVESLARRLAQRTVTAMLFTSGWRVA